MTGLTRAEVEAALADPDPTTPVAVEVARLIGLYTELYAAHCERLGRVATELMLARPTTAIEQVAMELTNQTLADEIGQPIKIIWINAGESE